MTGADIVLLIGCAFGAGLLGYGFYLKHQIDVIDRRIQAREEAAMLAAANRAPSGQVHPAE